MLTDNYEIALFFLRIAGLWARAAVAVAGDDLDAAHDAVKQAKTETERAIEELEDA